MEKIMILKLIEKVKNIDSNKYEITHKSPIFSIENQEDIKFLCKNMILSFVISFYYFIQSFFNWLLRKFLIV